MKTETKFRKPWNDKYQGSPSELEFEPSITVPCMSLTIRELMERHTRGIETDMSIREELYLDEDQEIPRVDDFVDIIEKREELEAKKDEVERTAIREKSDAVKRRNAQRAAKSNKENGESDGEGSAVDLTGE